MPDANDMDLVREFASTNSETAFTELVRRHINLVYSVAMRCTGNDRDAQDVTQAVFIILARKAAGLRERTLLTGWLYETTRFTAARLLRTNARRHVREQEAYMQSTLNESDTAAVWEKLSPHLEAAMSRLAERDRALLVLRFYENKSGSEAAALLGIREDAAHKRLTRAIEKLRKFFTQRGVVLTATAIAGAVSANSVQAVPAGLAVAATTAAAKGATISVTLTMLVKGTMKAMLWNNFRIAVLTGAAIILATSTITLFAQRDEKPLAKIPYKMLEDGWLFQQGINPTNLTFHFLIGSDKKGVRPEDIHLTIESTNKGNIAVQLGAKGSVLDFPVDDDLRRENPFVVSDQPKGTLGFGYWIYVPRPEGLTFRYDHLSNAVEEANKMAAHANQIAKSDSDQAVPMFPGTVNGIGLHFPQASADKANVTIVTSSGLKNYVADSHGIINLKINPKLKAENPALIFSERPDWIGIEQL